MLLLCLLAYHAAARPVAPPPYAGLEGLHRVDSVVGRVFKHNFTYADEAGRNVSLVYEAEHGEHVRIVPLDDETGLESFGGNVTSADIVNMTFASAAHADSFHARVAPGDVLVGGAHWGYADAAASQFALLSGPSILLRVEDALNRSDAVVSARVRAVPLESLFRSATFKLRVRLRPEDLRGLEMPREPVQTNGPDERALARRELSFNTAVKKVGRFVERNTKKVVEEIVSFAEEVKKHLLNLAAIFTDALSKLTIFSEDIPFSDVKLNDLDKPSVAVCTGASLACSECCNDLFYKNLKAKGDVDAVLLFQIENFAISKVKTYIEGELELGLGVQGTYHAGFTATEHKQVLATYWYGPYHFHFAGIPTMLEVVTVNEVGFDVMATVDFDVDLEVQGTYGPQVGFKYVKDEGFKPMAGGAFPDLELKGDGVEPADSGSVALGLFLQMTPILMFNHVARPSFQFKLSLNSILRLDASSSPCADLEELVELGVFGAFAVAVEFGKVGTTTTKGKQTSNAGVTFLESGSMPLAKLRIPITGRVPLSCQGASPSASSAKMSTRGLEGADECQDFISDCAAAIQRGWSCDDDFCGTCDYSGLCDAACTFCDAATDDGDDTVTSLDDGGSDAGTCRDVSGDCHLAVTQWGYLCAQDFCESCGVYASWCDRYCGYCAVDDDGGDEGCNNLCFYARNGLCDDGQPGSNYDVCACGSDCEDCGARTSCTSASTSTDGRTRVDTCANSCPWASDGECDDGEPGSEYNVCACGTDCADCGNRECPAENTDACPGTCGGVSCDFWVEHYGQSCADLENVYGCNCDGCVECEGQAAACAPLSCFESSCDYWVGRGYTCSELESLGCDCNNCVCDATAGCLNTCSYSGDGECDDGQYGSHYDVCQCGTDCADCGVRASCPAEDEDVDIWSGCDWVRSNSNTDGERQLGHASSPEKCISMVLEQCPGFQIANLPADGDGLCYCQLGSSLTSDTDNWMSCVLVTAPPSAAPPDGDDTGSTCTNTCQHSNDGECDDGESGSAYSVCPCGTDCNDCGARSTCDGSSESTSDQCTNTCDYAGDGECDDGQPGADYDFCPCGTDCSDCGARSLCPDTVDSVSNDGTDMCTNTCDYADDGDCDDGARGAAYSFCPCGTDCNDCGTRSSCRRRIMEAHFAKEGQKSQLPKVKKSGAAAIIPPKRVSRRLDSACTQCGSGLDCRQGQVLASEEKTLSNGHVIYGSVRVMSVAADEPGLFKLEFFSTIVSRTADDGTDDDYTGCIWLAETTYESSSASGSVMMPVSANVNVTGDNTCGDFDFIATYYGTHIIFEDSGRDVSIQVGVDPSNTPAPTIFRSPRPSPRPAPGPTLKTGTLECYEGSMRYAAPGPSYMALAADQQGVVGMIFCPEQYDRCKKETHYDINDERYTTIFSCTSSQTDPDCIDGASDELNEVFCCGDPLSNKHDPCDCATAKECNECGVPDCSPLIDTSEKSKNGAASSAVLSILVRAIAIIALLMVASVP